MEQNNVEWLKWVHMNYIDSEWKTCRVCGEQYPATEKFFYKEERNIDGLRNECVLCKRNVERDNYLSVGRKMAKNTSPSSISEGINNLAKKVAKTMFKVRLHSRGSYIVWHDFGREIIENHQLTMII